ncbi:MAG TPA: hypothetical protein DCQ26_04495 [Marinilabiliales bacterium]|jgi:hypothetical protein|nr:hypothetical protein [Salinivirgaceae bacterium]OFX46411.1 MAG: hypothetical protein A2W95_07215 [Bacteroidetes bacterium GWA2_40_14]OFX58545.1 MAG: hypothetical protein A2W84_01630 [Bacteroidetes bacterium GWC2_40_13]OFX71042.1 MAG: hypothetical protein A2W96_11250 [Bacteroidetes bacterium GWD2_40_43]OFX92531.1 MAG: hypothetical protein A2W97_10955 [Bacteroidetes bacterium GWE2_40_63]OFY16469.1 MAG: hypothetical protein A2W88_18315 [Bacteroidetes bacterium GWF2_40_13]OFZ27209.1 MAG: hypot
MNQIIRSNSNGQLSYDPEVKEFTVEFGNVYFKLPIDSYELFEKQLENMSNDLSMYASNQRLMVPVSGTTITLLLTPEEMISLKNLFGIKIDKLLSFKLNINYSMN